MSKKIKVAINGFGRIGRACMRIVEDHPELEVVAINDLTDINTLAHLLKYDSVYGKFKQEVEVSGEDLKVGGQVIKYTAIKDPAELPWKDLEVDVVLECTGIFRTQEKAGAHLTAGAKKVILSAPGKDDIKTYVIGVNDTDYQGEDIIDNASCTTNCVAPVMDVVLKTCGVKKAFLTTIHSYTSDQNLIDGPHKDLRRARAAAHNMIPTTTGAAKTTGKVLPELVGKFDGMAVRVPTIDASLSDLTIITKKSITKEELNQAFIEASKNEYKGILGVTDEPLVSCDLIGNTNSSIVDLSLTQVCDGDLVKVIAWYDNEWGYASRMVEMVKVVSK